MAGKEHNLARETLYRLKEQQLLFEVVVKAANKHRTALRASCQIAEQFIDALHDFTDLGLPVEGSTKELCEAVGEICESLRAINTTHNSMATALEEQFVSRSAGVMEEWKKQAQQLEATLARDSEQAKREVKRANKNLKACEKRMRRKKAGAKEMLSKAVLALNLTSAALERVERQNVHAGHAAERGRFCSVSGMLDQVLAQQVAALQVLPVLQRQRDATAVYAQGPQAIPRNAELETLLTLLRERTLAARLGLPLPEEPSTPGLSSPTTLQSFASIDSSQSSGPAVEAAMPQAPPAVSAKPPTSESRKEPLRPVPSAAVPPVASSRAVRADGELLLPPPPVPPPTSTAPAPLLERQQLQQEREQEQPQPPADQLSDHPYYHHHHHHRDHHHHVDPEPDEPIPGYGEESADVQAQLTTEQQPRDREPSLEAADPSAAAVAATAPDPATDPVSGLPASPLTTTSLAQLLVARFAASRSSTPSSSSSPRSFSRSPSVHSTSPVNLPAGTADAAAPPSPALPPSPVPIIPTAASAASALLVAPPPAPPPPSPLPFMKPLGSLPGPTSPLRDSSPSVARSASLVGVPPGSPAAAASRSLSAAASSHSVVLTPAALGLPDTHAVFTDAAADAAVTSASTTAVFPMRVNVVHGHNPESALSTPTIATTTTPLSCSPTVRPPPRHGGPALDHGEPEALVFAAFKGSFSPASTASPCSAGPSTAMSSLPVFSALHPFAAHAGQPSGPASLPTHGVAFFSSPFPSPTANGTPLTPLSATLSSSAMLPIPPGPAPRDALPQVSAPHPSFPPYPQTPINFPPSPAPQSTSSDTHAAPMLSHSHMPPFGQPASAAASASSHAAPHSKATDGPGVGAGPASLSSDSWNALPASFMGGHKSIAQSGRPPLPPPLPADLFSPTPMPSSPTARGSWSAAAASPASPAQRSHTHPPPAPPPTPASGGGPRLTYSLSEPLFPSAGMAALSPTSLQAMLSQTTLKPAAPRPAAADLPGRVPPVAETHMEQLARALRTRLADRASQKHSHAPSSPAPPASAPP